MRGTAVKRCAALPSGRLKIGQSFHSYTVKSFDRELEVVTLEKDGGAVRLHLRESKTKDGRMTLNGGITTWPGGVVRNVRASLFFGEDQKFPLGDGVTLHLTATRLPGGSIRYHPQVVARDKEGRESSDSWPGIIAPPGGSSPCAQATWGSRSNHDTPDGSREPTSPPIMPPLGRESRHRQRGSPQRSGNPWNIRT